MNFSNLSDVTLEKETLNTVAYLKRGETRLLHLLAEIEKRRLYSKRHPSLFEYCVKTLKLSCGSAQRRIDAMRAMKLIPELESKIMSGELNLASISKAQMFFRQEKKAGKIYSLSEKKQVLKRLENKNSRECTSELVAISPLAIPRENTKPLSLGLTQITIVADLELMGLLEQIKNLNSHKNLSQTQLLKLIAKDYLSRKDPAQKPVRKRISTAKTEVTTRYISAQVRKDVWLRDKGQCTYPDCHSKHRLQYDHIHPYSMGGLSTTENLRLRCQAHNERAAIDVFGLKKMQAYRHQPK